MVRVVRNRHRRASARCGRFDASGGRSESELTRGTSLDVLSKCLRRQRERCPRAQLQGASSQRQCWLRRQGRSQREPPLRRTRIRQPSAGRFQRRRVAIADARRSPPRRRASRRRSWLTRLQSDERAWRRSLEAAPRSRDQQFRLRSRPVDRVPTNRLARPSRTLRPTQPARPREVGVELRRGVPCLHHVDGRLARSSGESLKARWGQTWCSPVRSNLDSKRSQCGEIPGGHSWSRAAKCKSGRPRLENNETPGRSSRA